MNQIQVAIFLGLLAAASAQTINVYAPTCTGTATTATWSTSACSTACLGVTGVGSCKLQNACTTTHGGSITMSYFSDAACNSPTYPLIFPSIKATAASTSCLSISAATSYTATCQGSDLVVKTYQGTCAGTPLTQWSGSGCSTSPACTDGGAKSCKVKSCSATEIVIESFKDSFCVDKQNEISSSTGCSAAMFGSYDQAKFAQVASCTTIPTPAKSAASTVTASLSAVLLVLVAAVQLLN